MRILITVSGILLTSPMLSAQGVMQINISPVSIQEAPTVCTAVCHRNCGIWTGIYNQGTWCSCERNDNFRIAFPEQKSAIRLRDSSIIPITNDAEALDQCPGVCYQYIPPSKEWQMGWNGQWQAGTTTAAATCSCHIMRREGPTQTLPGRSQPVRTQPAPDQPVRTQPAPGQPPQIQPTTTTQSASAQTTAPRPTTGNVCFAAGTPELSARGTVYGASLRIVDEKAAEVICPAECEKHKRTWTKYWSNKATYRTQTESECGCN